jgi:NADH-quinone oxidoreductase subunit L
MVSQHLLITLIPALPLLGFLSIALNVRRLGHSTASYIACASVLSSFILSLIIFFQIKENSNSIAFSLFEWISAGSFSASMSFLVDPLSVLMMLIITGVGFLIHVYSIGYMHDDIAYNRFFSYLNLFVFFMLLLVMGSNYLVMFVGWEGVGLCSFLLIGFWFKNPAYNRAANKAFIMNRIGDLGMLLGIILIFLQFGTIEYAEVFGKASGISGSMITAITVLLFIGAMGKSAQLPLYTWLPDAMAGPTPVSALIHAATMVTAGIYMVARNNLLYSLSPVALELITYVGLATAIFAATIAIAQNDIKKVLAYSTVSQLGLMFFALGLGAFSTGVFHMATHAFFKALLFLCAGSVIHAMSGEQDIRRMGGLKKYIPVTFITFFIGVLAISGIPPFAGFFSKDEILAKAFEHSTALWILAVIASLLTAFYMFRLMFLAFFGNVRASSETMSHIHESPKTMTVPLMILAVLSTVAGFFGMPEVFSSQHALNNFLDPVFAASSGLVDAEPVSHATEYILMAVIVSITAVMIIAAYLRYVKGNRVPAGENEKLSPVHNMVYQKYFVDEMYSSLIEKPLIWMSSVFDRVVEQLGIDRIVNGFGTAVVGGSKSIRLFQAGNIGMYILFMVLGIISLLVYTFFAQA